MKWKNLKICGLCLLLINCTGAMASESQETEDEVIETTDGEEVIEATGSEITCTATEIDNGLVIVCDETAITKALENKEEDREVSIFNPEITGSYIKVGNFSKIQINFITEDE